MTKTVPVPLPLLDAPSDHPAMTRMLAHLQLTEAVIVPRRPTAVAHLCYWNVDRQVQALGGRLVLGWRIEMMPGVCLMATHHGIWESPGGELVDLTETNTSKAPGTTTFVMDPRTPVDLAFPVLIENRWIPLVDDPMVTAMIAYYRANNRLQQEWRDLLRSSGSTWTPAGSWQNVPQKVADRAKSVNKKLAATFADLHRVRAMLRRKYFGDQPI